MPLTPGARLGPYEVMSALGAGGMGEVYKARDTRLDRIVAVKVLPASLAEDPEFRHRFDREARTISQLTHPHICTLYDVGDGFLVMEYLEGETLADRLQRGQLPVNEAVRIAMQIAEALDQAHRAGIVHRDLKPGNVMLTKSGAKLLDFGLAKPGVTQGFAARATAATARDATPTMTTPPNLTSQGAILGTIQYMAPEVLEGAEADARSDIFAFGCVLYEMLTGRKAFTGKSQVSLIGAILKDTPAPITARAEMPPALVWLVGRCLAKNPEERRQSAAGLVSQLEWIAEGGPAAQLNDARPTRSTKGVLVVVGAAVALAAVTGVAVWYVRPSAEPPRPSRFVIPLAADLAVETSSSNLTISSDGRQLVYLTGDGVNRALWVHRLDQLEPVQLRGQTVNLSAPAISPDRQWVAFGQGSDIQKVAIDSGSAVMLAERAGGVLLPGITWADQNTIVFATGDPTTGLFSMSANGGEPRLLTKPDRAKAEEDHVLPHALPGGRAVLFTITGLGGENQVAVLDLATGEHKILVKGGSAASYLRTGHLVYAADNSLRAVRFDPSTQGVIGDAVTVVEEVAVRPPGVAHYAVSANGTLVYAPQNADATLAQRTVVWVSRQGTDQAIEGLPHRAYMVARMSPDGSRVAFDVRDQDYDLWTWDLRYRTMTRLTLAPGQDMFPVWMPDGKRIVFSSTREGTPALFWQASDGSGAAERFGQSGNNQLPLSVSPDGKLVVFRDNAGRAAGPDIGLLSLDEKRSSKLLEGEYAEDNATISPDGRWIAYESGESGGREVFVRPFPKVGDGRIQVSAGGGLKPVWARSGRELFYVDGDANMIVVPVQTTGTFERGDPQRLFSAKPYFSTQVRNFDVSPDGQRFLMIKDPDGKVEERRPANLNIVVNWFEELEKRVP